MTPILVGHLDTGVDMSHPTLQGRVAHFCYFGERGQAMPDVPPHDTGTHGTQTAVAIATSTPAVQLCSGVVIEGGDAVSRICAGLRWLCQQDVRVVCLALGLPYETERLQTAVTSLLHRDVLVVAAMGNDGPGYGRWPASYPHVLAVGAADANRFVLSSSGSRFFNRAHNRYKPDLTALANDTSIAAAAVTGAAASLFQIQPEAAASEIKEALLTTCTPPPERGFQHRYGQGIMNLHLAERYLYQQQGQGQE